MSSKNKCFGWGRHATCIKNFSSGLTVSVHLLYDVAHFLTNASEDVDVKVFGTQHCSIAPSISIRAPSANSSSTCSASNVSSHSNIRQTHSSTSTCQHNTCSGAATSTWLQISIQKWSTLSHVRKNRLRVLAVLHSRLFETPKSLLDSSVKCFTLRHHGIRKQETPRRFSLFQTPDLKAIILPGYLLTHFFRSLPFWN